MKQLIHNGIIVIRYEPKGFSIVLKGRKTRLIPQQEEMAVAWVKKLGTPYVEDKVFVENFFRDFSAALGINETLKPEDIDFSEIQQAVEKEKLAKLNMSKEEKKKLAADRKVIREANKEKYGYAILDGNKVELANYLAEPSCIFMGRGKHPLRGKWKQGPKQEDITLNLSEDAAVPNGNWKGHVWQSDDMWIAKWDDKLSHKVKYVWLADTVSVKQEREIEKFNLATKLEEKIDALRDHIYTELNSKDLMRRKVATVCYLIDVLKLRVGDEKDKDEADTCIPIDELILGEKCEPVQKFKIGDLVLNGEGHFTPIMRLFKRPYAGDVIKIHGSGLLPFSLTPDHPVLVAQRKGETGDSFDFAAPEFKPARELACGRDYLVFPKLKSNMQDYEIDLTQHPMLISRPGPQRVRLDERLARFLGLYLAEGCAILEHPGRNRHEGRIVLTFGLHEINLAREVASLASSLYHRKVRIVEEASCIRVIFFSLQLARFLRRHFGARASLKVIPSFLMNAPSRIAKAFIRAYFDGDAYMRTEKPHDKYTAQRLVLTTSSRILALQLQKLLSKIGVFAPISIKSGEGTKMILGRKVRTHPAYNVSVIGKMIEKLDFAYSGQRFRPRYYDAGDCFYIQIREIGRKRYNGDVFNFQTINGLFEFSNVTVHNCGATTLRPDHVRIKENGYVSFNFLGKDSVEWNKEVQLCEDAVRNLKEFISLAQSAIFDGVRSDHVKRFLGEVLQGLTAKVFRTYHASLVVREYLAKANVTSDDATIKKKQAATIANLQAAIECNHKKQLPKNWDERVTKQKERLEAVRAKNTQKAKERARELKIKIELMEKTGNYNLRTSLKSYIDPRVYYDWGKKVDYDWKLYYPTALQRKFSWVEKD
nr:LAGLIDADG family homing endonuclease [Candidatus Njordarchaeum guaymaensis]